MNFDTNLNRNNFLENIYLLTTMTWTNNFNFINENYVINLYNDIKFINNFFISKNKYENIKIFCGII
jgi:hypothetical protein